jgi:hypothetical protein
MMIFKTWGLRVDSSEMIIILHLHIEPNEH